MDPKASIDKMQSSAKEALAKGGKVGTLPPLRYPDVTEYAKRFDQMKADLRTLKSSLADTVKDLDAVAVTFAKNKSVIDGSDFELDKTRKDDQAIIKKVREILSSGIAEQITFWNDAKKHWQDIMTALPKN